MSHFTHQLDFVGGAISTRRTTIGVDPHTQEDRPSIWRDAPHLVQLRVGWLHPENVAERWTANLFLGGIGPVGPIDLPFTFNVEQAVQIEVSPLAAPASEQSVILLLCDLPNSPNLYGATYLAILDDQGGAPVPNWVVGATVFGGAGVTGTWIDSTGSNIGSFTGPQIVARPRAAVSVVVSGEGVILFHY